MLSALGSRMFNAMTSLVCILTVNLLSFNFCNFNEWRGRDGGALGRSTTLILLIAILYILIMHHYRFFIASTLFALFAYNACWLLAVAAAVAVTVAECWLISVFSVLLSTILWCIVVFFCCCHRRRTCECRRNDVVVTTELHSVCQYHIAHRYMCICVCVLLLLCLLLLDYFLFLNFSLVFLNEFNIFFNCIGYLYVWLSLFRHCISSLLLFLLFLLLARL